MAMGSQTKGPVRDGRGSSEGGGPAEVPGVEGRLLTSNFVFATLSNLFSALSVYMLTATLPVYAISLGGGRVDAGLVSGAVAITAMLFRPLLGWLTDAWRRRPLVLVGTSFYVIASLIYLVSSSIPLLVLGRLVQGFGLCCYSTASNVYVADIAPLKRRAEAVGLFAAAQAAGLVAGPVIGFMLIGWAGFRYLFYFTGGLAVAAFCFSLLPREQRQFLRTDRRPWSPRTDIVAVDALPIAWMALCMGLGHGTINAFISIFSQTRGLENPGFYFMVQAIALLLSRTLAGRLADRTGRAVVIVPGVILMTIALAMLPMIRGLPWFVVSASLLGIGFGSAQPATMALLVDRFRPEQRGLATGTYFTGFDLGFVLGTIMMGVVSQYAGYAAMWWISAAWTLLCLGGLWAHRRQGSPVAP